MMIIHLQEVIPSTIPQYDEGLDRHDGLTGMDKGTDKPGRAVTRCRTRRDDQVGRERCPLAPADPVISGCFDQASIILSASSRYASMT